MGWPQITWIALAAAGVAIAAVKHGERQSPHNFWSTSIGVSIAAGLLYAGGFFG